MKKYTKNILIIAMVVSLVASITTIINKIIFLLSTMKNKLYNTSSYYYQWKFGKIHYVVKGEGKPLLLIHGMKNGSSLYEYNKLFNLLSKDYKVYAIDLIGHGNSDKPKITYTAYIYVQLINDFIKSVIKQPVDVITSGVTNSFVTMSCHQDNTLFNKIIFINPSDINGLVKNPTKRDKILKYILELPILGTSIYNFINSKFRINKKFNNYFYKKPIIKKKYIEAFYEAAHTSKLNSKYVYASTRCKYTNVNIIPALKALNNSIYIIQGCQRINNHEKIINKYKEINPAIEGSSIDKTKEFPHIEKVESVYQVLSVFLND